MKMNVEWKGSMAFEGKGDSGHKISMDAAAKVGGEDKGARPMELILSGLGGCTGMDVVSILKKMRMDIEYFNMVIEAERAEEHPKRFTKININYIITGPNIDESKVEKAIELTQEKYCSVSKSLNAEISYSYEINGEKHQK